MTRDSAIAMFEAILRAFAGLLALSVSDILTGLAQAWARGVAVGLHCLKMLLRLPTTHEHCFEKVVRRPLIASAFAWAWKGGKRKQDAHPVLRTPFFDVKSQAGIRGRPARE